MISLFYTRSGVYMSELLHLYGELDHRVRPLVFTIRNWARSQNITLDGLPNQHLSNFMVTLLVLYFLQTRPVPVLPSIKKLEELAGQDFSKILWLRWDFCCWMKTLLIDFEVHMDFMLSYWFSNWHKVGTRFSSLIFINMRLLNLVSTPHRWFCKLIQ